MWRSQVTIDTPGMLGIIARKNERTRALIDRERSRILSFRQRREPDVSIADVDASLNQDDQLIGLSLAMNGADLSLAIDELQHDGCQRGRDFVVTSSAEGVLDIPLPAWLSMEERSMGPLPDSMAGRGKATEEMWARQRRKVYTFVHD